MLEELVRRLSQQHNSFQPFKTYSPCQKAPRKDKYRAAEMFKTSDTFLLSLHSSGRVRACVRAQ